MFKVDEKEKTTESMFGGIKPTASLFGNSLDASKTLTTSINESNKEAPSTTEQKKIFGELTPTIPSSSTSLFNNTNPFVKAQYDQAPSKIPTLFVSPGKPHGKLI